MTVAIQIILIFNAYMARPSSANDEQFTPNRPSNRRDFPRILQGLGIRIVHCLLHLPSQLQRDLHGEDTVPIQSLTKGGKVIKGGKV
jgi:hypothetical protein